jgi:catechol 2,3-dioxygenase-like lactoylglutathione lyase family enzyme
MIPTVEQRISLVTLGVTDLPRARSFYEALGWSGAQQPDDEVCFFQSGGIVFGLWTALGGHGAPSVELAHNVRTPEEVEAVLIEAQRAGGTIVRPAARAEWGGNCPTWTRCLCRPVDRSANPVPGRYRFVAGHDQSG